MTSDELQRQVETSPKVELSGFIERVERENADLKYGAPDVRGVSNTKGFIKTRANIDGRSFKKFLVVAPQEFVFNRRTTRNGERLGLGFNMTERSFILTEDYVCFRVRPDKRNQLSAFFLYLYFLKDEFDRYVRCNSWGSATEFFNWDDMCRVRIPLPPIEVQKAYVDAYKGLTAFIEQNEALLNTLEKAAQTEISRIRQTAAKVLLGDYIEETDKRNGTTYGLDAVRGISLQKVFIPTKADMSGVSLKPYKVIEKDEFAFVSVTSRNGGKISLAMNGDVPCICSSSYVSFRVRDTDDLLPAYLLLQFKRPEFDRYARFNSWGSARETFNWDDMCRVKIPLPPLEVQKAIVALYRCAEEARKIADEARRQLSVVCPAMIQRASHIRAGQH